MIKLGQTDMCLSEQQCLPLQLSKAQQTETVYLIPVIQMQVFHNLQLVYARTTLIIVETLYLPAMKHYPLCNICQQMLHVRLINSRTSKQSAS